MSEFKYRLDETGFKVLGNAILLGFLLRSVGRRGLFEQKDVLDVERSEIRIRRDLRDLLRSVRALDEKVSNDDIGSRTDQPETVRDRQQYILRLVKSDADFAIVTLTDFDWPVGLIERFLPGRSLTSLSNEQLRSPISRLDATPLLYSLSGLVTDYYLDRIRFDNNLTNAEATFIGRDGLLTQADLKHPPDWQAWNSSAARRLREEDDWLAKTFKLFERVVFRPVQRSLQEKTPNARIDTITNLTDTGDFGALKKMDGEYVSLAFLGQALIRNCGISDQKIDELFPNYGASFSHHVYDADADPFNVFLYGCCHIACHAVRNGNAVCITVDGVSDHYHSLVDPRNFLELVTDNDLELPHSSQISSWPEFDRLAAAGLGAGALRYFLAEKVISILQPDTATPVSEPAISFPPKAPRRYNRGFTETDAPFIAKGVEMRDSGEAKSNLDAANRLIDKYKTARRHEWTPECGKILTGADTNTARRLSEGIAKAMKERDIN